jgi:hypothetical protein
MRRPMTSRNSAKAILLLFSLGALADFLLGYIERRSMAEGVISVVLGLFGTAWYAFLFLGSGNDKAKSDRYSDDPRVLARWVP